jgi:hypothetical protein
MKPRIKLALGSYDRHGRCRKAPSTIPFFLEFLEVDPRQGRHERSTLKKREQNP